MAGAERREASRLKRSALQVFFEVVAGGGEQTRIGTAETVDGLFGIADQKYAARPLGFTGGEFFKQRQ